MQKKVVHAATEDCGSCHESNGEKHPNPGNTGFKLTDVMPSLCYNCHEAKNTKQVQHAALEGGECTMCHSPHSSDNNSLLVNNPPSKICFECHDLEIKNEDIVHQPVKKGQCQSCHNPHESDNEKLLTASKPDLCFSCHEDIKSLKDAENIHPPFDDDCATCHAPHNSENKSLLVGTTQDVCFTCHDGVQEEKNNSLFVHKPLTDERGCANCHSPHASNFSKFLYKEQIELCLECHGTKIETEKKIIPNIKQKISNNTSVHAAIESEGCVTCHQPHGAKFPSLLKIEFSDKAYPPSKVESYALCFECHDSALMTEEKTTSSTNFRSNDKNLHFVHVSGKKGRNCNLCHDMHGSKNEHLIIYTKKYKNWEMKMNYKNNDNGGSCRPACHGEEQYTR